MSFENTAAVHARDYKHVCIVKTSEEMQVTARRIRHLLIKLQEYTFKGEAEAPELLDLLCKINDASGRLKSQWSDLDRVNKKVKLKEGENGF